MSHLASVYPPARRLERLPLTRDQIMLLLTAVNEVFLGVDIYLAHSISGTIKPPEWIPIIFGPVAGGLLLLAGLVAFRRRPLASILASLVFVGSIIVGLLGAYFHFVRANIIATSLPAEQVNLLIWAPPFLGPLFFTLIGVLGISAAWIEDPADCGRLRLWGRVHVQMPYSKTRAYFFITSLGILATTISSALDHARVSFENPWVWLPLMAGIFGTVVAASLGAIQNPNRGDLSVYIGAMVLLIGVGLVGGLLHIGTNLVAQNTIVIERFIRGSPLLAPFVFSNWGLIGLIVLLDPRERG